MPEVTISGYSPPCMMLKSFVQFSCGHGFTSTDYYYSLPSSYSFPSYQVQLTPCLALRNIASFEVLADVACYWPRAFGFNSVQWYGLHDFTAFSVKM